MTIGRLTPILLILALSACSETSRTQVTVRVRAEAAVVSNTARLEVHIFGRAGSDTAWAPVDDIAVNPAFFPYDVALVPRDDDATRQFRVDVVAVDAGGATVVTDRLSGGYVEGQTLLVELLLEASCRAVAWSTPKTRMRPSTGLPAPSSNSRIQTSYSSPIWPPPFLGLVSRITQSEDQLLGRPLDFSATPDQGDATR